MENEVHLSTLIHQQAAKYGNRKVLTFRKFGSLKWDAVSWNQFSLRVKQVSNALLNLGAEPQEKIAVFSQNCVQYLYTDFGAYGIRAVTIPFYATSSTQQLQYIINQARIRFIFVGQQEQYDKIHQIFQVCHTLQRIIIFDPSVRISIHDPNSIYFTDFIALGENLSRQSEVERLCGETSLDDVCNILYTSGTTGNSKGVILTYRQYAYALHDNANAVPIGDQDRVMNFLPYAHIFERAWSYLALCRGAQLIINTYPKEIQQSMKETHPTCMSSVPRFWEKVYIAIKEKTEHFNPIQRKLIKRALVVGEKYNVGYFGNKKNAPRALALEYKMYDKTLFNIVRRELGLTHPHLFPCAGAFVSPDLEKFVLSLGIPMLIGYGLTESLATVSCARTNQPHAIGSVGTPIDSLEVKISSGNEILLKGPTITPGYYNDEEANKKAFDEDGFFHTGDAGYFKNGELFLTERIKDLYKTSNGKYIAPQMIESMLLADKYVDQVAVIADNRKFVSALIVPVFKKLEEYAEQHNIVYGSTEDLCANPQIIDMISQRIELLQQPLAYYEQIKRFTLMPHHFSLKNGELTDTLKLKRLVISSKYKNIIDKMYES